MRNFILHVCPKHPGKVNHQIIYATVFHALLGQEVNGFLPFGFGPRLVVQRVWAVQLDPH